MEKRNTTLVTLLIGLILVLICMGLIIDGPVKALQGFAELQINPARLINDFMAVKGIGASFINAALVGAIGLAFILFLKIQLSGPTYAAVFTLIGFGLFGKTPANILPIIFGVFLASKFAGKTFREYIIIALFGTALGPVVSTVAFELGFIGIPAAGLGIAVGIAAGFILPSLAVSMLHLHQGYNLYNMGLTCGFLGLFAASLISTAGHTFEAQSQWLTGNPLVLVLLVPVLSVILVILGFVTGGKEAFKDLMNIQKLPGRLPSDFMDMESMSGALLNSGLIGLIGSGYIFFIGGDFNGPVIGGLLTIMGFGAFGTHLSNSWPVLLGVIGSTLLFGHSLADKGPILAAIFVTTLGPLAGEFGIPMGILAGFIHFFMVMQTGSWHGAINLYNNGFAGGITASLLVALIQWYKVNRAEDPKFD